MFFFLMFFTTSVITGLSKFSDLCVSCPFRTNHSFFKCLSSTQIVSSIQMEEHILERRVSGTATWLVVILDIMNPLSETCLAPALPRSDWSVSGSQICFRMMAPRLVSLSSFLLLDWSQPLPNLCLYAGTETGLTPVFSSLLSVSPPLKSIFE